MSFLSAFEYDPSGDAVIDILANGVVWDLSQSTTISYAVSDGLTPNDVWGDRIEALDDFASALDSIQQYIDVQFDFIGFFSDPIAAGAAGADLVYTLDNTVSDDDTLAYAYFPGPGVFPPEKYASEGGDVFMNFTKEIIATSSFEYGSDGFVTIIHEIGHALGLKHPFEETPGRPSVATMGRDDIPDVDWMTVMSYTDPFADTLESLDPATPMVLDVLALQFIYGPNTQANAGDTLHRISSLDYYYSIWDPSGIDVIDVSSMTEGWTVKLPSEQFSTENPELVGLAMKTSEYREALTDMVPTELVWLIGDIEDVIGTVHDDSIGGNWMANILQGNSGNDLLEGQGGDDTLIGGDGVDTSLHGAAQHQYTLTLRPDGMTIEDRRVDGEGVDELTDIELLLFDGDISGQPFDLRTFGGPAGLSGEELETFIELYIAYFNRAPDAVGLSFWGTSYANGVSLTEMATLFIDQPETRATYAPDLTNEDFANAVYNNVLGRIPDQAGFDFWVGELDSGSVGQDQFILSVLDGAKAPPQPGASQEFIEQQQLDREYLATKTDLGALYAVHLGMSGVPEAQTAMSLFDGSQASITAAVAAIDQYHQAAIDPDNGSFLMPLVGVLDNPFDAMV